MAVTASSPFRFSLSRRKSAAIVDVWAIISRKQEDGSYVLVNGPHYLNDNSQRLEASAEIALPSGRYRMTVEISVIEVRKSAGRYNFRLGLIDANGDQKLYDQKGDVDTSSKVDAVVGRDNFTLVVV